MSAGKLGGIDARSTDSAGGTRVLFVCTGNICRSPVAELTLASMGIPGLHVRSAGTEAIIGAGVDPSMARLLEGDGIETRGFRARQLTVSAAERSDVIVTSTTEHRATVLREVPNALRRTFTVRELARLTEMAERAGPLESRERTSRLAELVRLRSSRPQSSDDIADPYRLSDSEYLRAYLAISDAVRGPLARLFSSFSE